MGDSDLDQTPAHERHNPDLLRFIPPGSKRLVEVGCSSGALAREFKKTSPDCDYWGIEIVPAYAELAKRHCDRSLVLNIEAAGDDFWESCSDRECWIFGDVIEHFTDPWRILRKVRSVIPAGGEVVACVPNAQHWSVQVRLNIGAFRYEPEGLLDKTHLRWFTKKTIHELFSGAGFEITDVLPRIFNDPQNERFLPAIELMAKLAGADTKSAAADSMPLQYVIRAIAK